MGDNKIRKRDEKKDENDEGNEVKSSKKKYKSSKADKKGHKKRSKKSKKEKDDHTTRLRLRSSTPGHDRKYKSRRRIRSKTPVKRYSATRSSSSPRRRDSHRPYSPMHRDYHNNGNRYNKINENVYTLSQEEFQRLTYYQSLAIQLWNHCSSMPVRAPEPERKDPHDEKYPGAVGATGPSSSNLITLACDEMFFNKLYGLH